MARSREFEMMCGSDELWNIISVIETHCWKNDFITFFPCMQRPQNDHQRPHHNQNTHQPLIILVKNLSKLMVGLVAVRLDHRVLVRVEVRPDKIVWRQWGRMVSDKNSIGKFVCRSETTKKALLVRQMMTILSRWLSMVVYDCLMTKVTILSLFTSMSRHCSRCCGWHKVILGPSWSKAGRDDIQR